MQRFTRGAMLTMFGAAGGVALSACAPKTRDARMIDAGIVPFYGAHQAGILTPQQERLQFAAFDVTTESRDELRALMQRWTLAAAAMTRGASLNATAPSPDAPPKDTGEAEGLTPARLTLTFGFGRSLFETQGRDRFGFAAARPARFVDLPSFSGEELNAARSDGDICVQACADDPQVTFHAIRNLARLAQGVAVLRWTQLGFGRTASTSRAQQTPRNLLGFKDGTNNLKLEDTALHDANLWITDGPAWARGGSYLALRRIRMTIESWDRDSLADQERTIGRSKSSGAPLGAHDEFDAPPFDAKTSDGPLIDPAAHVRLAHPDHNRGIHLLRRGYSFTDGVDAGTGQHEAGLFFISFQKDPQRYIDVQRKLADHDLLNEYIVHRASGLFIVPRGVQEGEYLGSNLI